MQNIMIPAIANKYSWNNFSCLAKCIKVYDGDTITIITAYPNTKGETVYLEKDKIDFIKVSCRLKGYNSAEIKTKDLVEKQIATIAKNYLSTLILNKDIFVSFGEFDKYGRPLIEIKLDDNETVSNKMISGGYGKVYNGVGLKKY